MKLIICDDCMEDLSNIENLIEQSCNQMNINVSIESYQKGENLLINYEEWLHQAEAIYLDIDLKSTNGIELAKLVRNLGYVGEIIFFTWSDKFLFDIFEVEPLDYLLKDDLNISKIKKTISNIYKGTLYNNNTLFYYNIGKRSFFILLKKVICFEVNKRIIKMYVTHENNSFQIIEFYGTLEQIEKQLNHSNFTRTHKSYIINFNYLQKITNQILYTDYDITIPIGRKYKESLHYNFFNFLENNEEDILLYEEEIQ